MNMNTRLRAATTLLVLAFLVHPSFAQDAPKPAAKSFSLGNPVPLDPNVRTGKLENGMVYYILKNGKPEKRAELRLAVNAGSVLESDDQQGLAHFCEHMAFNGTKNFKKDQLVKYLESIGTRFGAGLNAYTSFDETVYMLQIPTDKAGLLEKGIQVIEDWAHNISFEDKEIDKERGVIIEEMRSRKGASQRIIEKQYPVLFHNAKYADRMPIGKENILKSFKYETLKNFYTSWYRPDNMAVVAVGDFDLNNVEALIKEHFGRIQNPASPLARPVIPVPDHAETLFSIVTDPEATGTNVGIVYKHDPKLHKKIVDYRRMIIQDLYEEMFNGRLQELVQQGNPPFLGGYASYGSFARAKDAFRLGVQVENNGVERGLEAILTEALRAQKHGFTETELERAKTDMLQSYEERYKERDKTNSGNLVMRFVRHFLTEDPAPGIEIEYELHKKYVPSVKVSEVNEYASSLTLERNQVVTVSLPEKAGVRVPTEKELSAVFAVVRNKAVEPYVDNVANKPLVEVPESQATIIDTKEAKDLGLTLWTLSNGIRVVVKPTDFKNDEVLFGAYSPGGLSLISPSDYVSGTVAASVVDQSGIGDFDATQLRKALTGKTVNVTPTLSDLQEGFSGNAAPKDVETMFQLIYMYFSKTRKDTVAYQSFMKRIRSMLENMGARPESVFSDTVAVTMASYHPLRKPMNLKRLEEVDLDVAYKVYLDRFADASGFTFVFVGNVTPEKLRPLVVRYLGALPSIKRGETWKDMGVRVPEGRVEKTVRKGIDKKGLVLMTFTGPLDWNVKNRYILTSLGELMKIKLREEVREEKGGTYGVGVGATGSRYPRAEYRITINFGCNPDRVDELVSTANDVLKKIIANGASAADIGKIQEIQRREREKSLKENGFWLGRILQSYSNNDDPGEMLQYDGLVDGLSSEALKEAAAKYITLDRVKKFVLMPEAK